MEIEALHIVEDNRDIYNGSEEIIREFTTPCHPNVANTTNKGNYPSKNVRKSQ